MMRHFSSRMRLISTPEGTSKPVVSSVWLIGGLGCSSNLENKRLTRYLTFPGNRVLDSCTPASSQT
jgi:hypothetical protein